MSARQSVIVHQGVVRPAENVTGFLMHGQPEALFDLSLAREVTWTLNILGTVGTADSWLMRSRFQIGSWNSTAENFTRPLWYGLQAEQATSMIAEGVDWYGGSAVSQTWNNRATNPSLAVDTTGWTADAATGVTWTASRVAGAGYLGRHSFKAVATGTATAAAGGPSYVQAITASTTYSYGMGYKATIAAGKQRVRFALSYFPNADGTGTQIGSTVFSNATVVTSGVQNFLTFEGQAAPATAASVKVRVLPISGADYNAWAPGDSWEGSTVIVTDSPTLRPVSYFDGNSAGAVWSGSAGASASVLTFKPVASSLDPIPLTVSRTVRDFGALVRVHSQPFAINPSTDFGIRYSLTAVYELG